uniref:Uncharacterized protein n=1 Tax=Meloidogyne enterolobii TaxID=390850 RepID=A0A6V7V571_MELEN|nr:unnamed protein product [Meloidogyne enterolobii]
MILIKLLIKKFYSHFSRIIKTLGGQWITNQAISSTNAQWSMTEYFGRLWGV